MMISQHDPNEIYLNIQENLTSKKVKYDELNFSDKFTTDIINEYNEIFDLCERKVNKLNKINKS